jgi:hypothetical protein
MAKKLWCKSHHYPLVDLTRFICTYVIYVLQVIIYQMGRCVSIKYSDISEIVYWFNDYLHIRVSEWLLLNVIPAIVQLYHGENKVIFNEMMRRSALY